MGESLRVVDVLRTIEDVFFHFAMLKSWMFCIEPISTGGGNVYNELDTKVVRLHFYGSLEAMIPYFPPNCKGRLEAVCGNEIPELREEVLLERGEDMKRVVEMFWSQELLP